MLESTFIARRGFAAAGHGGQILVSQTTRDLAGSDSLRDLGEHRLKDLEVVRDLVGSLH